MYLIYDQKLNLAKISEKAKKKPIKKKKLREFDKDNELIIKV